VALDLRTLGSYLPVPRRSIAGRFVYFEWTGQQNLGANTYHVISRRGGFRIGHIELRNQWQGWSVKFDSDVPLNREILAECYAFMKRPEIASVPKRSRWRAALRDWLIAWL